MNEPGPNYMAWIEERKGTGHLLAAIGARLLALAVMTVVTVAVRTNSNQRTCGLKTLTKNTY